MVRNNRVNIDCCLESIWQGSAILGLRLDMAHFLMASGTDRLDETDGLASGDRERRIRSERAEAAPVSNYPCGKCDAIERCDKTGVRLPVTVAGIRHIRRAIKAGLQNRCLPGNVKLRATR